MGTRADFYVGLGNDAEWLGSIGWDGNPDGIDTDVLAAKTEDEFRAAVSAFLVHRDDATLPAYGWPWLWDDSGTTDYAYSFGKGMTWAACFGSGWVSRDRIDDVEAEDSWDNFGKVSFPDMSAIKDVSWGKRSGLITITRDGIAED